MTEHTEQPLPTVNDRRCVQDLVVDDILARKQIGIQRYGTALQPFNGRDVHRDLYEELLDATQYARQQRIEADALDGAMFTVWLHGGWHMATTNMTGDEREAAADAVLRHHRAIEPNDVETISVTSLRWWRRESETLSA